MQAASRQSYAQALERLDDYASTGRVGRRGAAAAGGASAEQLRAIADELLAVAGLLGREARLRRALSDPARPGEDRVRLLRGLVKKSVRPGTQQVLDALVVGRWSAASELLDGCEQLGVQALLATAERDDSLAEVEDELFRFGQVVAGDPALAAALGDRTVPVERRAGLADSLLAGKATEVTMALARVALAGFGGRGVEAAFTRLVELAAERRDRSVAYVTVAAPLPEPQEQRLGAALSARYGRDVSVKTTVDPRVLGGVRVKVGDDLYDGTVAHRLARARNTLT